MRSVSSLTERTSPLAVLLPTGEVGGHERMLFEWLAEAQSSGLRPTIHCRADSELVAEARAAGFDWCETRYGSGSSAPRRVAQWRDFLTTVRRAAALPREVPILLAPGAMQASLSHVLACLLLARRVACYVPMTHDAKTLCASRPGLRDWVTSRLAARVALWITIGDQQRDDLIRKWKVRGPVYVVPNRLRVLSDPSSPPSHGANSESSLRVLFAGRFDPTQKGLDWLVDMLCAKPEWTTHMRFVFQGRGRFQGELEALARHLGPSRVQVRSWGDVGDALRQADVLILPSRFEGFPLVAIEALHAGVPVVATLQSGLTDVLPKECIVPFGDGRAFYFALDRMRSAQSRESAVEYARQRLSELLSRSRYKQSVHQVATGICELGQS